MAYVAKVMTNERPSRQGQVIENDTIVLRVCLVLPRVCCIPCDVLEVFVLKSRLRISTPCATGQRK